MKSNGYLFLLQRERERERERKGVREGGKEGGRERGREGENERDGGLPTSDKNTERILTWSPAECPVVT